MLLSAGTVLVVAQSSSEIPEGLMNNPVYRHTPDKFKVFAIWAFVIHAQKCNVFYRKKQRKNKGST